MRVGEDVDFVETQRERLSPDLPSGKDGETQAPKSVSADLQEAV
jgi:hypothetical protein